MSYLLQRWIWIQARCVAKKWPEEGNSGSSPSPKQARIKEDALIPPAALGSYMEASRHGWSTRDNVKCLIELNRQRRSMSIEQVEASFINLPPRVSYPTMMINAFENKEEFKWLKGWNIEESFTHTAQLFEQVTSTSLIPVNFLDFPDRILFWSLCILIAALCGLCGHVLQMLYARLWWEG